MLTSTTNTSRHEVASTGIHPATSAHWDAIATNSSPRRNTRPRVSHPQKVVIRLSFLVWLPVLRLPEMTLWLCIVVSILKRI
jgi:hypothetical protein